jgi:type IX secretion system PorP/SprF family membrane protein
VSIEILGQQRPTYSLYFENLTNINPGYVGLDNALSITGVIRNQWIGIAGNPRQQVITAHLPYDLVNGGLGVVFESDETGLRKDTRTALQYSYYLINTPSSSLSVGMGLGFYQRSLDGTGYRTPTGQYSDGSPFDHNDQVLSLQRERASSLFADLGVFYRSKDWEGGFSMTNLNAPTAMGTDYSLTFERTFHLFGKYYYQLNTKFRLVANAAVLSNLIQSQILISTGLQINENIVLGLGLRGISEVDALMLQGGLKLNDQWKLFYAYDSGISAFSGALGGSHEIGLNFNINRRIGGGIPPRIIYSPRFL